MSQFVLQETLATKQRGKPIYFRQMTDIGPCATDDLALAKKFDSMREAMQSPAFRHALSFYEPKEVS